MFGKKKYQPLEEVDSGNYSYIIDMLDNPEAVQQIKEGSLAVKLNIEEQGQFLREAVRSGKYDIATALAEKYPDAVNGKNQNGGTALSWAVTLKDEEKAQMMLDMLLKAGAKFDVEGAIDEKTLVGYAAYHNPGLLKTLKEKGANTAPENLEEIILEGIICGPSYTKGLKCYFDKDKGTDTRDMFGKFEEDLKCCIDFKKIQEDPEYRQHVKTSVKNNSDFQGKRFTILCVKPLQVELLSHDSFKPTMGKIVSVIDEYNAGTKKGKVNEKDMNYLAIKIFTKMRVKGVSQEDIEGMQGTLLKGLLTKTKGRRPTTKEIKTMIPAFKKAAEAKSLACAISLVPGKTGAKAPVRKLETEPGISEA